MKQMLDTMTQMAEIKSWSPYQEAVFRFVEQGTGNGIVEAVAGSGKTTTIVEATRRMDGFVFLGAYNTKMGKELQERTAGMTNVQAGTFHSVGFKALRFHCKGFRLELDEKKVFKIAQAIADNGRPDLEALIPAVARIVSMAKQRGIGALHSITDTLIWEEMIDHFGFEEDIPEGVELYKVIKFAQVVLNKSNQDLNTIDFNDMVYLPLQKGLRTLQFDWVLIDEAQDTNPTRRALARKLLRPGTGRLIAVGDKCQPAGTKVERVVKTTKFRVDGREQVNIEDLKVGDYVASFDFTNAQVRSRKILGISSRYISEKIIKVTSQSGYTSKYTYNHKCIVKYKNISGNYCVYIMARNNKFRVGVSKMNVGTMPNNGFSPIGRLRSEDADSMWILKLFSTKKEARYYETFISMKYGIPMTMFTTKIGNPGNCVQTQNDLDYLWSNVDNFSMADRCLSEHNRNVFYPYFERGMSNYTMLRPHTVHACNLLEGLQVQVRTDKHISWEPAIFSFEEYSGMVYSMDIEKEENYFADKILTHNCQAIFGFTGADNDSLEQIARDFAAIRLPLTISYRCPKAVVAHAQTWVSHIEAHESAPEGSVTTIDYSAIMDDLKIGDAVLCRFNKYLVNTAFKLIRKGIPAKMEGRAIGEGLVKLASRWKVKGLDALETRLEKFQERELAKAQAKGNDAKADQIVDKVDTLRALIDRGREQGIQTVAELRDMILSLFEDAAGTRKPCVVLSSVHRSKGLEWNRVFLLGREEFMPSPMARTDWAREQELNLIYVAVTRAKEALIEVTSVKAGDSAKKIEEPTVAIA